MAGIVIISAVGTALVAAGFAMPACELADALFYVGASVLVLCVMSYDVESSRGRL